MRAHASTMLLSLIALLFVAGCGLGPSGIGGVCDFKASDCMAGTACYAAGDTRSPAYCGLLCSNNADCGGLDCTCTTLPKAHYWDNTPVRSVCVLGPSNTPCR